MNFTGLLALSFTTYVPPPPPTVQGVASVTVYASTAEVSLYASSAAGTLT